MFNLTLLLATANLPITFSPRKSTSLLPNLSFHMYKRKRKNRTCRPRCKELLSLSMAKVLGVASRICEFFLYEQENLLSYHKPFLKSLLSCSFLCSMSSCCSKNTTCAEIVAQVFGSKPCNSSVSIPHPKCIQTFCLRLFLWLPLLN